MVVVVVCGGLRRGKQQATVAERLQQSRDALQMEASSSTTRTRLRSGKRTPPPILCGWWLKFRRRQPRVYTRGGFELADLLVEPVLQRTGGKLGGLRFQSRLLGCNTIFKGVGFGSATLHDTTSCLLVLAVGFALPILIMPSPGGLSGSEHKKSNVHLRRTGRAEAMAKARRCAGRRQAAAKAQCRGLTPVHEPNNVFSRSALTGRQGRLTREQLTCAT